MSEPQPVSPWVKYVVLLSAVIIWVSVIAMSVEGRTGTVPWWLMLVSAVLMTLAAIDFLRRRNRT